MYRVNLETGQGTPITITDPLTSTPGAVPTPQPLIKPNAAILKKQSASSAIVDKIDRAIALLDASPDSVGIKTLTPDILLQRTDPEGIAVRAAIGELGAEKTHDLYGAAFSGSEQKRANSFIPASGDSVETIRAKLNNLKILAKGVATNALPKSNPTDKGKPAGHLGTYNPDTGEFE